MEKKLNPQQQQQQRRRRREQQRKQNGKQAVVWVSHFSILLESRYT